MPISHKSYIHQPTGYTSPLDLNLFGRVLQFKQAQYDAGVAKVQGTIDSIASLDAVKDVDKQYINSKLNSLVGTINNIGGADYSDPNITNQIAGLSSQIYSDKNIITAVANTKRFRYVQQYYKDLKEKKPKDYNTANEWYDFNKFSGWLQDGKVGTNPDNGAGQVTPYNKYEEDWQKMFDKITQSANVTTEITDKGLMYRIDSHKLVSPERIWEVASKMLNPNQRQQIGIEGRYTYNPVGLPELVKAYDAQTYEKVAEAQGQLEDYRAKLKGATDITDQEKYEKLVNEKESELNRLVAPLRRNQDQIKESLYLNDKLRGLQARYAFQQSTTKLQPAQDKMFRLNYALSSEKLRLQGAEFQYRKQRDAADREADLAIAGLRLFVDPLTGMRTYIKDPTLGRSSGKNAGPDYSGIPGVSSANEGQKETFTKETLDTRKGSLVEANKKLFQDFVRDFGRKKGLSDVIVSDLMDDGNLQAVIDPEIQRAAQEMMNAWNAMTRGEKINYDQLDPLFKGFAGRYQQNNKEIEAIDTYISNIDKQVARGFNITDAELQKVNRYEELQRELLNLDNRFPTTTTSTQGGLGGGGGSVTTRQNLDQYLAEKKIIDSEMANLGLNPKDKRIKSFFEGKAAARDALIQSADVAFNLPNLPLSDDKEKSLAKLVTGNALAMQMYSEQGKPQGRTPLNPDNIELINKGYSYVETADGFKREPTITFKNKTGKDTDEFEIVKVTLTPPQQIALGFGTQLKDLSGYNLGLKINGEVKGINTTTGQNYDLQYDIVKYKVDDQNDNSVFLRVKKGNNVISLYNRPFPTYEQAIQFMESSARLKSSEEAYKYLTELAK